MKDCFPSSRSHLVQICACAQWDHGTLATSHIAAAIKMSSTHFWEHVIVREKSDGTYLGSEAGANHQHYGTSTVSLLTWIGHTSATYFLEKRYVIWFAFGRRERNNWWVQILVYCSTSSLLLIVSSLWQPTLSLALWSGSTSSVAMVSSRGMAHALVWCIHGVFQWSGVGPARRCVFMGLALGILKLFIF